jgi:transposase
MVPIGSQISQFAGMIREDICLYVSPSHPAELEAIIADRNSSSKVVWRAQIVLAAADGLGTKAIMKRKGKSKPCRWRCQERYIEEGVNGLLRDKTWPSRVPPLPDTVQLAVLTKTAKETPVNATHWSRTSMAKAAGISQSSVGRIRREAGLKPHRIDMFNVSNAPPFEKKVTGTTSRCRGAPSVFRDTVSLCDDDAMTRECAEVPTAPMIVITRCARISLGPLSLRSL